MVSGESHYFLGQRYRLRVLKQAAVPKVVIRDNSTIELHVRREITAKQRERLLERWYRRQLKELVPPVLEKWQSRLGVWTNEWAIKKMKTKWGACNVEARRIWLNLELAKKPVQCLEYIIVHELVYLVNEQLPAAMEIASGRIECRSAGSCELELLRKKGRQAGFQPRQGQPRHLLAQGRIPGRFSQSSSARHHCRRRSSCAAHAGIRRGTAAPPHAV
jgi:hypothetical protein